MKIAITTGVYFNKETGLTDYARIRAHGYDCVDFNLCDPKGKWYRLSEEEFTTEIKKELQKIRAAGLEVCQLHGPWPTDDTTEESRAQKMQWMQRAVRATALMDCPYMVVHPVMPFGWSAPEDAETAFQMNLTFFRELCDYAAPLGVGICVENMPFLKQRISTVPRITELVKQVARDNCFICLDTGHCNVFKDNPGEMVRHCARYLSVLHVHDNNQHFDSHDMPYSGRIRWEDFTTALKEVGFGGVLSLETKVRQDYPDGLREEILILLARIAKALANQCE